MRLPLRLFAFLLVVAATGFVPAVADAATVRAGFAEHPIASGLSNPTAMAFAPDGRVFICEQGGSLRVVRDGQLLATPFVRVTVNAAGERGLLGVAIDPFFPAQPFVYVYYTATTPAVHNRVSRFTASGDVAVAGSEVVLLDLPNLSATNHNGGAIHFGPDGMLYIGVGENAVGSNAQSLNTPLGKLLRISRDGSIPASNPFFGQTSGINRAIWALGLRNPFTFAFDPASARLLINDVGQDAWEEVNDGFAGANYGWPATEGPTTDPRFTAPLYAYSHASTGGCAITGAAFYPALPSAYPAEFSGDYFFAELCAGWIRQLDLSTGTATELVFGISSPVDLAIGLEGSLYYLARGSSGNTGTLVRIDFLGGTGGDTGIGERPVPSILAPVASALYVAGSTVRFAGQATDREDGMLPASRFVWTIVFHHDTHTHDFMGPVTGISSGSFRVPDTGETSANVWYRIHLTVTDSSGRSSRTFRDIRPRTAQVRIASSPSALTVVLDGVPVQTPHAFRAVVGMRHRVQAVSPQSANGTNYVFRSWSDRGASTHTFIVPSRGVAVIASFKPSRDGGAGSQRAACADLESPSCVQPVPGRRAVRRPEGSP